MPAVIMKNCAALNLWNVSLVSLNEIKFYFSSFNSSDYFANMLDVAEVVCLIKKNKNKIALIFHIVSHR